MVGLGAVDANQLAGKSVRRFQRGVNALGLASEVRIKGADNDTSVFRGQAVQL
jgi:hypothetical protein